MLLASNATSYANYFIDLISAHVVEQAADWLLVLIIDRERRENFLMLFIVVYSWNVLITDLVWILANW